MPPAPWLPLWACATDRRALLSWRAGAFNGLLHPLPCRFSFSTGNCASVLPQRRDVFRCTTAASAHRLHPVYRLVCPLQARHARLGAGVWYGPHRRGDRRVHQRGPQVLHCRTARCEDWTPQPDQREREGASAVNGSEAWHGGKRTPGTAWGVSSTGKRDRDVSGDWRLWGNEDLQGVEFLRLSVSSSLGCEARP